VKDVYIQLEIQHDLNVGEKRCSKAVLPRQVGELRLAEVKLHCLWSLKTIINR